MELRELAQEVLFGATLQRKLIRATSLSDEHPGSALERAPEAPARSPGLLLASAGVSEGDLSRGDLRDSARAARVLLSFANHELQAMELFALALLRFPDAPQAWRRELGHVLVEEQEHMRLYLARAESHGGQLGEAPLSGFFWRCLRGLKDPRDVIVGLGLTFEQANLDYARHYADRFAAAGDAESAAVLERVCAEEIGHVAASAAWLKRELRPGEDDWDAYRRLLPAPLTPRRARGLGPMQIEARRAAGLSERFLSELAVFGASKGRPPHVYWFVPGVEDEVADGRPGFVPKSRVRAIQRRWAPWLALLASEDDVVVVPERPDTEWLARWRAAGRPLPEWIETGDDPRPALAALAERGVLGELRPWGWSPRVLALLEPLGASAAPSWVSAVDDPLSVLRRIHAQPYSAEILSDLRAANDWDDLCGPLSAGATCPDLESVRAALHALEPDSWHLLKRAYGASGSGLRRLAPGEELDASACAWLRKALAQGPVRVEPWWERTCDLSLVFQVDAGGLRRRATLTWPCVDAHGRYTGHASRAAAPPGVLRLLHGPRAGMDALNLTAAHVAQRLADEGYRGPAGIDAFVAHGPQGLWLHPLVEINPRTTFGHLAAAAGPQGLELPS